MKTLVKLPEKNKLFHSEFYVFDTETTPFKLDESVEFKFGIIYGHEFCKVIFTKEEFKKEFEEPRYRNKKIFAHNAEFDLNVIYDNIYQLDQRAIFNNKFISATNGNCVFADSMNIFRTSVKEIGKLINLHKLDTSVVLDNKSNIISEAEIKYCKRDCEIVYTALLYIFETAGSIKITAPSLSLDYFRRQFQPYHIDFNELAVDFFSSYYGGRTEAFKIGDTKSVVYDANSMYPFAMVNCVFPNPRNLREVKNISVSVFLNKYINNYEGSADISIYHKDSYIGFLPYRLNGKLVFPVGNFRGFWNFNELRFALENNIIEIKEVHRVVFAERMLSPFKKFIDVIYERRKHSEGLEKETLKLFMNSLYGKFAQRIKSEFVYIDNFESEENYKLIESYEIKNQLIKLRPFNQIRKDIFIEIKSELGDHLYNTIPVFSSYITSFARVHLLRQMLNNIESKPIYCDTDSIFFEVEPNINDSNELGEWKRENKLVTKIRGLKNYDYIYADKEKSKIKGVPGKAIKTGKDTYKYESLVKTKEGLVRQIKPNTLVNREKRLTGKYDKRIVFENGDTQPIKL